MPGVSDDGTDPPSTASAAASSGSKGGGVAAAGEVVLMGLQDRERGLPSKVPLTLAANAAAIQRHAAATTRQSAGGGTPPAGPGRQERKPRISPVISPGRSMLGR
ncbi:hypothetical protein GCM10010466_25610 [Planomonospora alba]|uniref:Uncharacterized protein n=1 Tax=Planomonospora alba TaxID=161354 RepID=A0ABP6N2L9_9ACTN